MKSLIFFCLACLLATSTARAGFESLAQPCRGFNVLASRVVKDPAGKEWFVLSNTNESTGVELIFIDFQNNTAKKYPAPAGQGAWLLNPISNDRLIVGTYYDGKFMVFDLKSMSFTNVIPFPGEQYIWNGAIGSDGRLYGGTFPGAKLGALDLATLKLEDCGAPALPNLYCRNVSATPDGRLLCHFISNQVTKLYDPKTHAWSDVPPQMKHVQRSVTWNNYLVSVTGDNDSKGERAAVFQGEDFQLVDPPPFPLPPDPKTVWSVDLVMTTPTTLYLRQSHTIYKFAVGDKALTKIFDQDLKAGAITAVASDGTLLGLRGQNYIIAAPGESAAKFLPIPVEPGPRPAMFLRADDHNHLWGGPEFGQTLFSLDLATKKFTNTDLVCNSGGEVYDCEFFNDKIYAVAYVGGDIIEYDPAQPWDQLSDKNPRTIAHLTTRGYIRPIAGVHLSSDGKLYSGWEASYGTYGGAIAVTDPATRDTKLIENPLGPQAIGALALDDRFLYVGTSLGGNGLPKQPDAKPHLGILNRADGKVVYQQPLGAANVGRIILDRKTNQLVLLTDNKLRFFDLASRKVKDPPPEITALDIPIRTLVSNGDGKILFAAKADLYEFDLVTTKAEKIAAAKAKIEIVCVGPDGAVYIASGPDIEQLKPDSQP